MLSKTIPVGKNTWYLHPDETYYPHPYNPPDLQRTNASELQERQAFGKNRLCLSRSQSKGQDEGNNQKFLGATVEAIFYISDKRTRDLDGMMTTIMDCLVASGAIPDDNWRDVCKQISEGRECPKGKEQVEITIKIPKS